MEFCDECGGIMFPRDENGIKVFKCKCGATKPFDESKSKSYKLVQKIEHSEKEELISTKEILKWKEENLKSTIKGFKCSRCGYDKAHLETRQTRRADEGMTHFIVCLRCGKMRKIGS
ncbi:MAG: RPA12/RPB9/RPC11 RNA polymerase family protein [Promethearchaeota archaeon]